MSEFRAGSDFYTVSLSNYWLDKRQVNVNVKQKAAGTFVCPEEGAHVYQCDNGDIACDSYNQMDRDIQVGFQSDVQT